MISEGTGTEHTVAPTELCSVLAQGVHAVTLMLLLYVPAEQETQFPDETYVPAVHETDNCLDGRIDG